MFKRIISFIFNALGYSITKSTPPQLLITLLNNLRPTKTSLIRFGSLGDGGYLIPNDLEGINFLISPGISDVSDFEKDCLLKNIEVFMYDASIEQPNLPLNNKAHFFKKYLKNYDYSTDNISMNSIFKNLKLEGDGILQMDIENFEYEVLLGTDIEFIKRFRIIVIEFHSFHELFTNSFYSIASCLFYKLLESHTVVHFHPNYGCGRRSNGKITLPRACEITFLRSDRIAEKELCGFNTHALDHIPDNYKISDFLRY